MESQGAYLFISVASELKEKRLCNIWGYHVLGGGMGEICVTNFVKLKKTPESPSQIKHVKLLLVKKLY